MSEALFSTYLNALHGINRQGDAREESFYPALADMLKAVALATGRTHVHVTTLPRPTEGGNPDFRLWNGTDRIIGYLEAKKPTEERLDDIEDSEQLKRYRSTFPNLILTNFLEFRLYRNGECERTVVAARPLVLNTLGTSPPIEKPDELRDLLDRFLGFSLPPTFTAESLAIELAKRTRLLRDVIAEAPLADEHLQHARTGDMLSGFFEAFRDFLIGSLTQEAFADLFAQTITYGLFAARTRAGNGFNRRAAFDHIPHTIGVLRDLFRFISLGDLPDQLAWCVDDIAEVLAVADAPGILDRYYREGRGDDPIVHFYETFLAEYDPEERERRGVYYTPEPVVGYIVRSLHGLLKTDFDEGDGLASDDVTLLDPAAGTMTFVARAARQAVDEFVDKYGGGSREDFIRQHILKNFYALELMMAPYAVGHLKMGFFLEELGHRLADDERMPFYLTNTLDMEDLQQSSLPGLSALAEESRLAGEVKKRTPILLILGNPPYSYYSSNTGDWIRGLIEDYKQVDGKPLGEKNPRGLQDDYVKFLRFAQWKIERAGRGTVGMITNHGYLDNPTFRGMRQSLMRTFDAIYFLDLHGNALKKEICPDGSPDQNVFDIRQGVAIAFFVKRGDTPPPTPPRKQGGEGDQTAAPGEATVHHAELYGTREAKYAWLDAHDRERTEWQRIEPRLAVLPVHTPRRCARSRVSAVHHPSPRCFLRSTVVGLYVTARDKLTIHWSAEEVWDTVRCFLADGPRTGAAEGYRLGEGCARLESGDGAEGFAGFRSHPRERSSRSSTGPSTCATPITPAGRSGFLMQAPLWGHAPHAGGGESGAVHRTSRASSVGAWWHGTWLLMASRRIVAISNKTSDRGGNVNFPLYVYPVADSGDLFAHHETSERKSNLNPGLVAALAEAHGGAPSPEAIFHYIYAVLYAPAYREKYAEFLRIDFPRVPFAADGALFSELAALGERLSALHLLQSPELDPPTCRFEGEGDSVVARTRAKGFGYDPGEQRVYVNRTQAFGPVPPEVYAYRIGGYQVCDKWLKDRKERRLEVDDIRTYCRIVTALGRTLAIQERIDALYPGVEEHFVAVSAEAAGDESGS